MGIPKLKSRTNKQIFTGIGAFALILGLWGYGQANKESVHDVVRIVDGDTVKIKAPYLPEPLDQTLSLRIVGVDTPETHRAKCDKERELGERATRYTTMVIKNARKRSVVILDWDKFGGRVIGDILLDGKSLKEDLIDKGYAVAYDGTGSKKDWCR